MLAAAWLALAPQQTVAQAGPQDWVDDLTPIAAAHWSEQRAGHLLERAGFGGTPEEIRALAALGPEAAVRRLVQFKGVGDEPLAAFDHSGVHDAGLDPFPPSRPATTQLAKETGEALGVKVKPAGNRRLQPVVNRFFYWLRASRLETDRVGYWWANRMLASPRPLEEKMALFWHGHFATNEDKVRDYRKMLGQIELFQRQGLGSFRDLLIGVAQDPAMLAFLDAGVNVKGAPNENFAREIMELFTMGVGNYTESDIREAARAFTGWNFVNLSFVVNHSEHDASAKTVLGRTGPFDGIDVIDIILSQPVTAEYLAAKIYRYFVREELSDSLRAELGARLRESGYDVRGLLQTLFLSRDFYSAPSYATHIKSPVQLVISTYRKLGLTQVPGVPDFNEITQALGQRLLHPPTVAGWARDRSWITPGLLIARGNFAYELMFPDISFVPKDHFSPDPQIRAVGQRIARGFDISSATVPDSGDAPMSMSNQMADRDEDFNTRYGSYKGWQMAIQKVKPIPRHTAHIDVGAMVLAAGAKTSEQAIDYLASRFLRAEIDEAQRHELIAFLGAELGTDDLERAASYMDEALRMVLHLMMSLPEYQLG
ncbi:MAG: DUF1800 domain-containing protein [Gammaproteobacteria bacterium]